MNLFSGFAASHRPEYEQRTAPLPGWVVWLPGQPLWKPNCPTLRRNGITGGNEIVASVQGDLRNGQPNPSCLPTRARSASKTARRPEEFSFGAVQAAQAWRIPKAAPLVAEGRGGRRISNCRFQKGFPASGHRLASCNAAHKGNRNAGGNSRGPGCNSPGPGCQRWRK